MRDQPTILERAYELARTGSLVSVADVRRKLKDENYDAVDQHVSGSVTVSLRKLMQEARTSRAQDQG